MASKITIEFIDDPEAALMAMDAPNLYQALREVNEMLRQIEKYDDLNEDQHAQVVVIREKFFEILNDKAIKL